MDKQEAEKRREKLRTEYNANIVANEIRIDELRKQSRDVENSLDESYYFYSRLKNMLEQHQEEHAQYGAHAEVDILGMVEYDTNQDYCKVNYALLDEQDEIEKKRKNLYRDREEMDYTYRRAQYALEEEGRK